MRRTKEELIKAEHDLIKSAACREELELCCGDCSGCKYHVAHDDNMRAYEIASEAIREVIERYTR